MNAVVYHVFCVGNYLDVVNRQLKRLVKSGLYDFVDCLEVTCVDPTGNFEGIDEAFSDFKKASVFKTTENRYEWWGIKKCWELSQKNEGNIFYFHAKGVSNKYIKAEESKTSELKIKGIQWWTEAMEYFCIDNWQECIGALKDYNNCGVTCINGWWWGNFWWSTMDWIRACSKPVQGDRWYFEAWLNHARLSKTKEFHRFTYNPYYCLLPDGLYRVKNWFEGKNVEIISAEYGTIGIQTNESEPFIEKNVIDVTDQIKQNFLQNEKKRLYMYVSNNLENTPHNQLNKCLVVRLKADEQLLQFCVNDGMWLDINL